MEAGLPKILGLFLVEPSHTHKKKVELSQNVKPTLAHAHRLHSSISTMINPLLPVPHKLFFFKKKTVPHTRATIA